MKQGEPRVTFMPPHSVLFFMLYAQLGIDCVKHFTLIFTPWYLRDKLPLLRHSKSCVGVWLHPCSH